MTNRTCAHCGASFHWPKSQSQPRKWCYTCLPPIGAIDAKPWIRQQSNLQYFAKTSVHGRCCDFSHEQVGPPAPFRCAVCRAAHWGPSKAYCRDCKAADLRGFAFRPPGTLVHCGWCGWSFVAAERGRPRVACSPACATAIRTDGKHGTPPESSRLYHLHCVKCGEFVRISRTKSPGPHCAPCLSEARRDRNRRKNNKRRGMRGQCDYTLAYIAERDGCRCHLCGKKVNMALPGSHNNGPTIDHLVPVSAGGMDVATNVRLAHKVCNSMRGAGGEVQLLLVA